MTAFTAPHVDSGLSPAERLAAEARLSSEAVRVLAALRRTADSWPEDGDQDGYRWAEVMLGRPPSGISKGLYGECVEELTRRGLYRPLGEDFGRVWRSSTPIATATTREADLPAKTLKILGLLRDRATYFIEPAGNGSEWVSVSRHAGHLRSLTDSAYREHVEALIVVGAVRRPSGAIRQFANENYLEVRREIGV